MDADEVTYRHRVFALAGAVSMFIGGWLMVVEDFSWLGLVVLAPGALVFGMSQRLARLPHRLQYIVLGVAIVSFFAGRQYREAHRWDWVTPANIPKCETDKVPAGGCYTVSTTGLNYRNDKVHKP